MSWQNQNLWTIRISGRIVCGLENAMVTPVLQQSKKKDPGNYSLVSFPLICGAVMDHLFQSHEGDAWKPDHLLWRNGRIGRWGARSRYSPVDPSKAFNFVSHKILIDKLIKYGMEEEIVRWIETRWMAGPRSLSSVEGQQLVTYFRVQSRVQSCLTSLLMVWKMRLRVGSAGQSRWSFLSP